MVSEASGLMPDGLPFDIPEADSAPPLKQLAPYFEADQQTADIYLSIPDYRERGSNVSMARQNMDSRYRSEVLLVRDENSGLSEKPIQIARKNLRLQVEGESRLGTTGLRIARVRKTPAGSFQLDPQFVPPLLDIAASDYLMSILRRLVEIVSAKGATLSGLRRQKNQSLADFTTADVANFWLLYTVNTSFPLLRHLFEVKRGHPEGLFAAMTALAGSLTTFSLKIQPRDLPIYDHDELGRCFTDLDLKLRELLETVVPSNFVSLPLKLVQQSIYATAVADDRYLANTKMYLAMSADMKEVDLVGKAPYLVKVCSATHIETLVRQALPGVQLTHTPNPPSALPIKMNYVYFSLNQSGAAWEAIQRSRNLAAYVPNEFPNPQMELMILLPQAI